MYISFNHTKGIIFISVSYTHLDVYKRQAIARSFLRKKPILILDEATSALDPETEVSVLKSVKSLPHKPTCIIITHRPSALNICHRIIRLEKGHLKQVSKESILEVATELV